MHSRPGFPIAVREVRDLEYGLDGIVRDRLAALTAAPDPFFIHMLGIPGAGKSTFAVPVCDEVQRRLQVGALYLGFDRLMAEIPGYSSADQVAAFARYEIPAREAGYALLQGALERRANVVFDHGGASVDHPAILRYAREAYGYGTFIVYVKCDFDVARARVASRASTEGRHVPSSYLEHRREIIGNLIPKYVADVTAMFVVDNSAAADTADIARSLANCIATIQGVGVPSPGARPNA